jgi:ribose 5-phosphate isomerase B
VVRKIALAADHGGIVLKVGLIPWLETLDIEIVDLGAEIYNALDDYPDFAEAVAESIINGQVERGILICGSGAGAAIAANKMPGIRACLCQDTYTAHQGVEHDDMNILCLGGRVIGVELAKELITAFLKAEFLNEEKYRRRVNKVLAIEARYNRGNISNQPTPHV